MNERMIPDLPDPTTKKPFAYEPPPLPSITGTQCSLQFFTF